VTVPTRNPLGYVLAGGLGLGLLVVAGIVAVSYRRGFDRQRLEQRVHELRYSEWISTGSIPDAFTETTISIDSLEGLVDVAIDTDNRVIHDGDHNVYVVVSGSAVYYYSPDGILFAETE